MSAEGRLSTLQENLHFWVLRIKLRPPDGNFSQIVEHGSQRASTERGIQVSSRDPDGEPDYQLLAGVFHRYQEKQNKIPRLYTRKALAAWLAETADPPPTGNNVKLVRMQFETDVIDPWAGEWLHLGREQEITLEWKKRWYPPITYYRTRLLILDPLYLVGNLPNSKIPETESFELLKSWHFCISKFQTC